MYDLYGILKVLMAQLKRPRLLEIGTDPEHSPVVAVKAATYLGLENNSDKYYKCKENKELATRSLLFVPDWGLCKLPLEIYDLWKGLIVVINIERFEDGRTHRGDALRLVLEKAEYVLCADTEDACTPLHNYDFRGIKYVEHYDAGYGSRITVCSEHNHIPGIGKMVDGKEK
jgi:hypothetical protein